MYHFVATTSEASDKILGMASHSFQNLVAIVWCLFFMGVWITVLKHRFWGPRLRSALKSHVLKVALVFAGFFFIVAWLDAISWKTSNPTDDNLSATVPRSVLDRAFASWAGKPEWDFLETSFSSPMAHNSYKKIDGEFEPLKFPGKHLLGTNKAGQDTLYLVLKGCKPAVMIGTLPLLLALPLALILGICAGFFGGFVDEIVVYIYTTMASIPSLLLLIALVTAMGTGVLQVSIGLGVTGWIALCRLVRAETFKLRELEYIQAAKCLGVSTPKIIWKHIVPNLMHIVLITLILSFTGLVLSESILSYLGVGLDGSWGALIDNARTEIAQDPVIWWNIVFTSAALFMLVLSVNVVGDALRDALDPRTSSE